MDNHPLTGMCKSLFSSALRDDKSGVGLLLGKVGIYFAAHIFSVAGGRPRLPAIL